MLAACEGYLAAFRTAPPRLAQAATSWLEKIRPPQWTLEWSLPFWLGESLRLPAASTRRLVLSNVVGLAYIRLQDALADGEFPGVEPAAAMLLSTLFYQRWMQELRSLFGGDHRFWSCFDSYLAEWVAATVASTEMPAHRFQESGADDFRRLAHRGAPLKVCGAGACLLASREDLLPALADAIDHLLVCAVLLDHAHDWSDDLDAGRYNVFVDYASPLPQTPPNRKTNTRMVQQEICLGEAARPYFRIARDHLWIAGALAEPVECPGLQGYLRWLDAQAATCSERLVGRATALLDDAVRRLFGPQESMAAEPPPSRKESFPHD
jgi:hypothetical protein